MLRIYLNNSHYWKFMYSGKIISNSWKLIINLMNQIYPIFHLHSPKTFPECLSVYSKIQYPNKNIENTIILIAIFYYIFQLNFFISLIVLLHDIFRYFPFRFTEQSIFSLHLRNIQYIFNLHFDVIDKLFSNFERFSINFKFENRMLKFFI
jgi:hypothetical protein